MCADFFTKDFPPGVFIWFSNLQHDIETARSQQCRIESSGAISCTNYQDIWIELLQIAEYLLHLSNKRCRTPLVATCLITEETVKLIKEKNDRTLGTASLFKYFT